MSEALTFGRSDVGLDVRGTGQRHVRLRGSGLEAH